MLVLTGRLFFENDVSLGLLVGGILSLGNYYLLSQTVQALIARVVCEDGTWAKRKAAVIVVKHFIRFACMAVLLYSAIVYMKVNIFGLLIGLASVIVSMIVTILAVNIITFLRKVRRKDASLTVS